MKKTHNSIAIGEHNKKEKQGNRKSYTKQNEKKNVNTQKQLLEVYYRKAVPKYLAIFKGKHLCWSLFLIKLFL